MVGSLGKQLGSKTKTTNQKKEGWDWERGTDKMIISQQPTFPSRQGQQTKIGDEGDQSEVTFLKPPKIEKNSLNIPDLSALTYVDQLYIHEEVEMQQLFCGYKNQKNYRIMNADHDPFWTATQETDFWSRLCESPLLRPFDLVVRDELGRRVLNLSKDSGDCCCCYWPCCFCCSFQSLEVYCGQQPEQFIGKIQQELSLIGATKLTISDEEGKNVLWVRGPRPGACSPIKGSCCSWGQEVFEILGQCGEKEDEEEDDEVKEKEILGKILRNTSPPCLSEVCNDKFEIQFPLHLDTNLKATLISAALLIDLIYFDFFKKQQRPNQLVMLAERRKEKPFFY